VYKLQGRLHKDRHDVGPSVSFPVGQFTGGEMVFPQLNTKLQCVLSHNTFALSVFHASFRYSPGDFCIFFSSIIYHKVAPFTPLPQTPAQKAQDITPGRIGSVFFFPGNSLRMLEGKPDRWGYRTAFGRMNTCITVVRGERLKPSRLLLDAVLWICKINNEQMVRLSFVSRVISPHNYGDS